MPIAESDISIVIPTYRYRDKVGRALDSALASGTGEIIVNDDCSGDGTMELLAQYKDPRLKVFENTRNLGLWENHLAALGHVTKPWVKFIQADDYLLPNGLAKFAEVAGLEVSVVSAAPICRDDDTGRQWLIYSYSSPIVLSWNNFRKGCLYFGWLLGTPSFMLLRTDAIDTNPDAWVSDISSDLVVGSIAASKGCIVLLPPGAIAHGVHAKQDTRVQNSERGLKRKAESLAFLRSYGTPDLRDLANIWTQTDISSFVRTLVRGLIYGEGSRTMMVRSAIHYFSNPTLQDYRDMLKRRESIKQMRRYRKSQIQPFDLDVFFDEHG